MTAMTIADLFCGAGGTSTGALEAARACGRTPQLTAVNHWPVAVATHEANHPEARHFCASLDALNPRDLFKEGGLDLLWASPECTHHSKARGGKPINDQSRATAWCVTRWAEALRPDIILIENVPEFRTWGPIGAKGRPLKRRKGEVFRAWVSTLQALGYTVDWRVLCAADYGDPTTRERLFVQAVRGRRAIVWPTATHSKAPASGCKGWVPARDIIDWSLPGTSIFDRKRPLSPKTLARIDAGLRKFGLKPFLTPGYGERPTQPPRTHGIDAPAPTIAAQGRLHLAEPFIIAMEQGQYVRSIDRPLNVVSTARGGAHALCQPALLPQGGGGALRPVSAPAPTVHCDGAIGLVEPFLVQYYGTGHANSINEPLATVTTRDRHALVRPVVTINGERYQIDVRFRMLQPRELAGAQGFLPGYQFTGTKTEQVKQIGNAVPRRLARAIVAASITQNPDVRFLEDFDNAAKAASI
jgi:DNA (cytosine-5)-methyltransferase 1